MLWDIASGQPIGRPVKLGSGVRSAAWSPDGRSILTGGMDRTARLWDVASGRPFGHLLAHPGQVTWVRFGPDGRTILTGYFDHESRPREARLWETRLWNAATGQPLGPPLPHPSTMVSAAMSPDGRTLLTACNDGAARRWDAATGEPIKPPLPHPGGVGRVVFSPDGRTILTVGSDPVVRRWDGATGQPIEPPLRHPDQVYSVAFSPDGRTILTGCADRMARLWDAATGQPLGPPPVEHPGWVYSVAFSPDGKMILTGCRDKRARLWDADTGRQIGQTMEYAGYVPVVAFSPDGRFLLTSWLMSWGAPRLWDAPAPLPEDAPRLTAWVEAATGLELDERGSVRALDRDAWQERRRRLGQLGGPPPPDHATRLDPMLYGDGPAARGDAFAERGLWDQAEAAYLEAVRARPLDAGWDYNSAWVALTRFYIARGRPERAVAELGAAVSRWPDDLGLRVWHCLALLAAGDRVGWERAIAGLLDRFQDSMHPRWGGADKVAWVCAQGPYPLPDPEVPVRLAEAAIRNATEAGLDFKASGFQATLGAVLYRAGRYDEAIRRLEEQRQAQGNVGLPATWAFLAMAHHRLGDREEALRWLDQLRQFQLSTNPANTWQHLANRLLRSEAEAVILYDPVFPNDPFAR
jgi:tetratricopeptide (TPR) repeat protein